MSTFQRLGTANMYDATLRNLATRQKTLVDLQENLTSGKRVVRASDDPVAAAQAERALTRIGRIQTEQRQLEIQRHAMAQAESALGDAVGLVQEMRQLVIGAGGGALTPQDRKTYADQIQGLREQFSEVINRKDTNGMPLLGALGSALQAFAGPLMGAPDYGFSGLPGQGSSQGNTIATALDGHAALVFDAVRDGIYTAGVAREAGSSLVTSAIATSNRQVLDGASYAVKITGVAEAGGTTTLTYDLTKTDKDGTSSTTSGLTAAAATGQPIALHIQEDPGTGDVPVMSFTLSGKPVAGDSVTLTPSPSLMSSLDATVRGLGAAPDSTAAAQVVGQALAQIDAGMERLHHLRGYAGELLNRVDRIGKDQEDRSIQLEADRSRAEDMDMIQGISQFQNANTSYQAALQTYAQVQRLSLFDYLR